MSHEDDLAVIGLRRGEVVRFHRADRSRWLTGRAVAVERDRSILIHDADGSARSIRLDDLEVRRPDRRGRLRWLNGSLLSSTEMQLGLFD